MLNQGSDISNVEEAMQDAEKYADEKLKGQWFVFLVLLAAAKVWIEKEVFFSRNSQIMQQLFFIITDLLYWKLAIEKLKRRKKVVLHQYTRARVVVREQASC